MTSLTKKYYVLDLFENVTKITIEFQKNNKRIFDKINMNGLRFFYPG